MGRKKKKNKNNPYILEHMTEDDQRIGSLVDQGVSVSIDERNKRNATQESVDINL